MYGEKKIVCEKVRKELWRALNRAKVHMRLLYDCEKIEGNKWKVRVWAIPDQKYIDEVKKIGYSVVGKDENRIIIEKVIEI